MNLYLLLCRLPVPFGYAGKFFLVAFVATHLPLLAALVLMLRDGRADWPMIGALLGATLLGFLASLAGIRALLAPVRRSTEALRAFAETEALPALPIGRPDLAGRLMTAAQDTLTGLATALTAARGAQREAMESVRLRERSMTEVTHELRTPLNAVLGFAELLQMQPHGPLGHRLYAEFVDDIAQGGQHMLALIEDVQRYAALREGRQSLDLRPVELESLVHRAVRLMRREAASRGVEVVLRVPAGSAAVADARSLQQVVLNLLGNAVKYAGRGRRVEISAELGAGEVSLRIADNGPGMDAAQLRVALQPFGRVGDKAERGTGLGLPLAQALAELQGGRFALESVPGHGTTARLTLPAA